MALREARVWGVKERLYERAVPLMTDNALAQLLHAAQLCDGLVKGLKHPDWPLDPWDGLKRLPLLTGQWTPAAPPGPRTPWYGLKRLVLRTVQWTAAAPRGQRSRTLSQPRLALEG